jgi:predicted MFS family arabinose efflux permease
MSPPGRPPRELGSRASFWVSAAVVGNTLWTSAAPAVTYPLYAAEWHLSATVTTAIFAVYPITVVAVLLLFGNLSDFIGRRRAILWGLGASLIGALLFGVAPSVSWVFAGRAFMGIGVGLVTSPATAAMVEFSAAAQSQRASSIATAATAAGLALATILGGALIQYAPFPTHLNFWVLFVVLLGLFGFSWMLPRRAPTPENRGWRPAAIGVPAGLRRVFVASAVAVTAAYAHGAIMLSIAAQVAHDVIGSSNALVNGAAIALFASVAGVTAILAKPLPARTNIVLGGLASAAGMALLMLSVAQHSLGMFLAAAAVAGVGYSLLFLGGLALINADAPVHHRAATLSAVYLIAFLTMGVTALSLGAIATARGLAFAIDIGAPVIALLSLVALGLAAFGDRARVSLTVGSPCPNPLIAKRS